MSGNFGLLAIFFSVLLVFFCFFQFYLFFCTFLYTHNYLECLLVFFLFELLAPPAPLEGRPNPGFGSLLAASSLFQKPCPQLQEFGILLGLLYSVFLLIVQPPSFLSMILVRKFPQKMISGRKSEKLQLMAIYGQVQLLSPSFPSSR